jgi:cytosolic carboxypeptidase protein 2/3
LEPKHSNDYLMLASTLPYSYSRLLCDLAAIEAEAKALDHLTFSCESVCTTICDNEVPEVTITGKSGKEKDKRVVILMARQHPGEVWSSYMVLGVMRGLLKSTEEVRFLLEHCVVKIYPMINVDGVIYGNFRCDATGVDLNRRWR